MESKYHAVKTRAADGTVCDSAKEARRLNELLVLLRLGRISELKRQVKYQLIPAQYKETERFSKKTGKKIKPGKLLLEKECSYIADFVYKQDGKTVVEDTKGARTPDYIIKRKLMLYIHGIRIRET